MNIKNILKPISVTLVAATILLVLSPSNLRPSFLPNFIHESNFSLGLDLQGGSQLDYQIDLRKVDSTDHKDVIDGITEIINKRVNKLGVSEPNIYTSKVAEENHIIVELAGVNDLEEAKNRVGKTIQLEFKEENNDISENQIEEIKQQAGNTFVAVTNSPKDFNIIAEKEQKVNPDRIFQFQRAQFESEIANQDIVSNLKSLNNNQVFPKLIETDFGLVNVRNKTEALNGYALLK